MGSYLSEPQTLKASSDESNEKLNCGASSMQGWRITQEDAHNCILDFDKNTSYFAVYDGHGGSEVSLYTSMELPKFLRELDEYKAGDIRVALVEAFLKFDATIVKPDVIARLKELAGPVKNIVEDEDEENVKNLYEEATMPIEKVIEKYTSNKLSSCIKNAKDGILNVCNSSDVACSSSSIEATSTSNSCGTTSENAGDVVSSSSNNISSSDDKLDNGKAEPKADDNEVTSDDKCEIPDSSADKKSPVSNQNGEVETTENNEIKSDVTSSSPRENGDSALKKGKGKALTKTKGVIPATTTRTRPQRTAAQLYNILLQQDSDEDDSEDEEDVTFEGPNDSSDGDDDENEVDGVGSDDESSSEDENGQEEADEEEEVEMEGVLSAADLEFCRNIRDEPGSDSGCTAVVALLRENELYVANAGDSRCVVSRNGEAIEMSFDHKPEDEPELRRITKAGGRISLDGRVNGGLNLSRAIGDHAYKQNKNLSDREQMITALPDIKTLTINPAEDEFMVLACDGIWNFMSSQEVIDFVRPRLQEGREKVSKVCEELFQHCLAPNTVGDGTGCDNMTAVIVQFKPNLLKRSASEGDDTNESKRAKTEESTPQVETTA